MAHLRHVRRDRPLDITERGKLPTREIMRQAYDVNAFGAEAVTEAFIPLLL
ncbi:hypothetical protein BJX99DRAFT_257500 [Aspergillus californicus]